MSAPGTVVLAISTPVEELPELFLPALQQTVQMVGITVILAILLGTPLAVILHNTAPRGLFPNPAVNAVAGWVVNLGRSLPFLVLMAAIIPFTRFIVGTSLGVQAAAVPMTLAATPYVARLIENSLRDVPPKWWKWAGPRPGRTFRSSAKCNSTKRSRRSSAP
ncbi:putative D-methionine transport system permease protein metI [Rhodococcus opacus PD630]|nr:putative D-methionine transport system permease protein metI [Rhodococcus opacus PD630]